MTDEISLKNEAKGIYENLESNLENWFPKNLGQDIGPVRCYVDRVDPILDDMVFDKATGVVSINGQIRYKTSNNSVINQAGLGIDVSVSLKIKYDVIAADLTQAKVQFDLPKGWGSIDVDLATIKAILDGDLSKVPDLIPNFGIVKRKTWSEYDQQKKWYQDKYGQKNVYFASSDFVRWCSPETAGRWIITLVQTGGAAAPAIVKEAAEKARKELAHIVAWLEQRGVASALSIATDFVSGKPITLPSLELRWQRVTYHSQVVIGGRALPDIPVEHGAFVLVWKESSGQDVKFNEQHVPEQEDNDARPKWRVGLRYAIGPSGCTVIYVLPNGPADKAGVRVGDTVTKVNGVSLGNSSGSDLLVIELKKIDQQVVAMEVLYNSQTKTVTVTLDPIL